MEILLATIFVVFLAVIRGKIGHKARSPIFSTLLMSLLLVAFIVVMIINKEPINMQGP